MKQKLLNLSHAAAVRREAKEYQKLLTRGEGKLEAALRKDVAAARRCYESGGYRSKELHESDRKAFALAVTDYLEYCGWTFKPFERGGA